MFVYYYNLIDKCICEKRKNIFDKSLLFKNIVVYVYKFIINIINFIYCLFYCIL